jgi:ABC-2 type transport system permease protein
MSGRSLFINRFIQEWRYQWSIIRTVLDWTVILYIIIPAILFLSLFYVDAWQNMDLYWNENLPFSILVVLILLLSSGGNFRTFLLEADLLHLLQQRKILYQLKVYGLLTSLSLSFLQTVLIFFITMPILVLSYQFSIKMVLFLFVAIFAYKLAQQTLNKIIYHNFKKLLLTILLFSLSTFSLLNVSLLFIGIGSIIGIIGIVYFHISQIKKTNRWFLKELEIEQSERVRYIRVILNFSMAVEKQSTQNRKKPIFLFKKSERLFKVRNKENGLLELLLKNFLRNRNLVMTYFRLMSLTGFAIIALPIWIKWLVFISYIFFINSWIKNLYSKMLKNSFLTVIPVENEISHKAYRRFRKFLSLPSISFLGILIFIISFI